MKIKDTFFRIFNFFLLIFLCLASFSCEGVVFYHNGRLKDDLEAKYTSTVRFFAEKGDLESTAYVSYSYKMGTELSIYDLLTDSKLSSLNPGYYLASIDFYRIVLGDLDDDDSSNYSSSYPENMVLDAENHLISYVVGRKNVDFVLNWSEKQTACYTVNHWCEKLASSDFELYKSEVLYGYVDELTEATAIDTDNELIGFVPPSVSQISILSDGSTVINLYYFRVETHITLDFNGGIYDGESYTCSFDGKYGQSFNIYTFDYSLLTYSGYKFLYWQNSETSEILEKADLLEIVFGLKDYNFIAIWEEDDSVPATGTTSISVSYPEYSSEGEIKLSSVKVVSEILSATAEITSGSSTSSSYTWFFNNEIVSGQTGSTFSLDISTYSAGVYELMVVVELEEGEVSASAEVKIIR